MHALPCKSAQRDPALDGANLFTSLPRKFRLFRQTTNAVSAISCGAGSSASDQADNARHVDSLASTGLQNGLPMSPSPEGRGEEEKQGVQCLSREPAVGVGISDVA